MIVATALNPMLWPKDVKVLFWKHDQPSNETSSAIINYRLSFGCRHNTVELKTLAIQNFLLKVIDSGVFQDSIMHCASRIDHVIHLSAQDTDGITFTVPTLTARLSVKHIVFALQCNLIDFYETWDTIASFIYQLGLNGDHDSDTAVQGIYGDLCDDSTGEVSYHIDYGYVDERGDGALKRQQAARIVKLIEEEISEGRFAYDCVESLKYLGDYESQFDISKIVVMQNTSSFVLNNDLLICP